MAQRWRRWMAQRWRRRMVRWWRRWMAQRRRRWMETGRRRWWMERRRWRWLVVRDTGDPRIIRRKFAHRSPTAHLGCNHRLSVHEEALTRPTITLAETTQKRNMHKRRGPRGRRHDPPNKNTETAQEQRKKTTPPRLPTGRGYACQDLHCLPATSANVIPRMVLGI